MFPFVGITLISVLTHAPVLLIGAVTEGSLAATAVWIGDIAAPSGIAPSRGGYFFFTASSADKGKGADEGQKE